METTAPTVASAPQPATPSTPLWLKRLPMITGLLAGLAGFLTVRSNTMSNQAIFHSNQAVLHQSLASDHWEEYQADSVKRHIDQNSERIGLSATLDRKVVDAEIADFASRQATLKQQAHDEEQLREAELKIVTLKLAVKNCADYADVIAQLAIALLSVAALTKKRVAFYVALFVGVVALLMTGYALGLPYLQGRGIPLFGLLQAALPDMLYIPYGGLPEDFFC